MQLRQEGEEGEAGRDAEAGPSLVPTRWGGATYDRRTRLLLQGLCG